MSDEKVIWICPLCTKTFRSLPDFNGHLQHKLAVVQAALKTPERCARVVNLES